MIRHTIIGVSAMIMLRCSSGGSMGDTAGGGVIGNPTGFGYVDSTTGPVVTTFTGQPDLGSGQVVPIEPLGSDTAQVNHAQSYSYTGAAGMKRFLFSSQSSNQVSSLMQDSAIVWTWTIAGACSVQVQLVNGTDTSKWSEPLIVRVVE